MESQFEILFEPLQIGPKTLPNRFLQVPHCTSFGSIKPYSQARFRGTKAEGGWGAVFTEECSIAPEADQFPYILARLWDDDDAQNLALMCDEVHAAGSLAGVELWYGGVHTQNLESRGVSRSVSEGDSDAYLMAPNVEMTISDIHEIQNLYVAAAMRAKNAGFDIICIYGGHEGLPEQFLSPHYNKRTDEYGGSVENRSRFWRELLEKVNVAVGDDCAISVRMSVDSLRGSEGIELDRDVLPFIAAVDSLVDLWDLHIGGVDWGDDAAPSRFFGSGRSLDWIKRVKEATTKPVVAVGRFTDPGFMAKLIRDGVIDVVGAARPSIADPFLPNKIKEGRPEDIRECIGCNMCVARFEQAGPPIVCTQNATAGEEYRRGWHPEKFDQVANREDPVLIVGAGPAGMECARVLAERGMENVHLIDQRDTLGGHLNWLTQLPGLNEWGRITDYRQVQLDKLPGVTFIPNQRMDAESIIAYGAPTVILANGARWSTTGVGPVSREGIPGANADLPNILTPEQILDQNKPVIGKRVVIIDQDGYHVAASLADRLLNEGKQVTLATHYADVAPYTEYTLEANFIRRKLHSLGLNQQTQVIPRKVDTQGVWVSPVYGSADELSLLEADAVVLVTQRHADRALFDTIMAVDESIREDNGVERVFRIGDCYAPRVIAEVVFDGHRLAREIDSDNPQIPLPFKRERLLAIRPI